VRGRAHLASRRRWWFVGDVTRAVVRIDLELTEGGPGRSVLRHLRLAPQGVVTPRTAFAVATIAWLPLLVFSTVEGRAIGGVGIPFLYDVSAHVRFLFAVPLLMLVEIPIGARMRHIGSQFLVGRLVRDEDLERYEAIIADALRWRDARLGTVVVVAAAYLGAFAALTTPNLNSSHSWHARGDGHWLAWTWYALVSVPVLQMVLYRWVYRMIIWTGFLFRVSRLRLALVPTHPDGAGGLGFLGKACIPFGLLLFATNCIVASSIATAALYDHVPLPTFYGAYAATLVIAVIVFAGPLVVFLPLLARTKHEALETYGVLANRYGQLFEAKWIAGGQPADEPLLGSGDIQSLADLGNAFGFIKGMRFLPMELADFVAILIPGILPALPLALFVMPLTDIVRHLAKLLV
jgi:hypothetical protein